MVAYSHLAIAAAQAELGQFDEARRTLDELDNVSPGYLMRMESDLAIRHVHADIVAALRVAIDKVRDPLAKSPGRYSPAFVQASTWFGEPGVSNRN